MLTDELERADVPQRVRDRVATIDVESGHLAQMVNELLDLSRIEQATSQVRADEVAVGAARERHAARGCARSPSGRASSCAPSVPDDLPPIRGEEERLGQLLVNLLHNAIKFSPEGGVVTVGADAGRRHGRRSRSPTRARASRGRSRRGSSSASTRSTARVSAGRAAPASASRSPATSPRPTAGASGSSRPRAPGTTLRFSDPGRLRSAAAARSLGLLEQVGRHEPAQGAPLMRPAASRRRRSRARPCGAARPPRR